MKLGLEKTLQACDSISEAWSFEILTEHCLGLACPRDGRLITSLKMHFVCALQCTRLNLHKQVLAIDGAFPSETEFKITKLFRFCSVSGNDSCKTLLLSFNKETFLSGAYHCLLLYEKRHLRANRSNRHHISLQNKHERKGENAYKIQYCKGERP